MSEALRVKLIERSREVNAEDGDLMRCAANALEDAANGISEAVKPAFLVDQPSGAFTLLGAGPDALDAARYRYLRNVAEKNTDTSSPIVCAGCGDDYDFLGGTELDEAIDEAIKETK